MQLIFNVPKTALVNIGFTQRRHQSGAVLAVSLILLISITIFSIFGMNSSILNEQLASHAQDLNREFQAAESVIDGIMNEDNPVNRKWLNEALLRKDIDETIKLTEAFTKIKETDTLLVEAKLTAKRTNMTGVSLGEDTQVSFVRLEVKSKAKFGAAAAPTEITHGYIRLVPNE